MPIERTPSSLDPVFLKTLDAPATPVKRHLEMTQTPARTQDDAISEPTCTNTFSIYYKSLCSQLVITSMLTANYGICICSFMKCITWTQSSLVTD